MRSTCGDVRWLLTVPSDQLLAEVGYPAEVDTPPAASSADAAAAARLAHRSHPNLLQQHSPLILGSSAHKIFTDLLFLCVSLFLFNLLQSALPKPECYKKLKLSLFEIFQLFNTAGALVVLTV